MTSNKSQDESPQPEEFDEFEFESEERLKRDLVFNVKFLEDLKYWVENNRKMTLRLLALVKEIRRDPFEGTGKPEQLRYHTNIWSRRLTQADRIVYMVSDNRIDFLQARYHYSDR